MCRAPVHTAHRPEGQRAFGDVQLGLSTEQPLVLWDQRRIIHDIRVIDAIVWIKVFESHPGETRVGDLMTLQPVGGITLPQSLPNQDIVRLDVQTGRLLPTLSGAWRASTTLSPAASATNGWSRYLENLKVCAYRAAVQDVENH